MADNVTVGNESGQANDYVVASEELSGGAQLQSVELHTESAGTKTKFGTSSNPVVVDLGTNNDVTVTSGTVTVTGVSTLAEQQTQTTHLSNIATSLNTIDNAVSGNEMQVDVLTMPTVAVTQSGTWDEVGIHDSGNSITVDGTVSVTGVATAANQTTIIGHVDGIETAIATTNSTLSTIDGHVDGIEALIGTTNTNTGASTTALQIIDDWDESDRAKVNPIAGQAGIAGGTGVDGATVPRVTLATNVALPAGTNGIGKLTANSGVDIGDVDVTSVLPGTTASSLGKAEDAGHNSGDVGVMALGVRNDSGSTTFGANGDYSPIAVDASGRVQISTEGAVLNTVTYPPAASEALEPRYFHSVDLDESEEEVEGDPTVVYGYYIYNAAASARFVRFYNNDAATVIVGTDVPDITLPIPAGSAANLSLGTSPWLFDTALTIAATTGAADNDTGAPSAGDVMIQLWYSI